MATNDEFTHGLGQGKMDQLICGICGQCSDSVIKFLQHKLTHIDRGTGRGCEICQLAFSRQAPLQEHYRRKHQVSLDSTWERAGTRVAKAVRQHKVKAIRQVQKTSPGGANSLDLGMTNVIQQTVNSAGMIQHAIDEIQQTDDNTSGIQQTVNSAGMIQHAIVEIQQTDDITSGIQQRVNSVVPLPRTEIFLAKKLAKEIVEKNNDITCITASLDSRQVYNNIVCEKNEDIGDVKVENTCWFTDETGGESRKYTNYNAEHNTGCIMENNVITQVNEVTGAMADGCVPAVDIKPASESSFHNTCDHTARKKEFKNESLTAGSVSFDSVELLHQCEGSVNVPINGTESRGYIVVTPEGVTQSLVPTGIQIENIGVETDVEISECVINGEQDGDSENITEIRKTNIDVVNNDVTSTVYVAYRTKGFRKKGKLTPVSGKIPHELDMPDFYFLNIVRKSGKTSVNTGHDEFKCLYCTSIVRWRTSMCRHMRERHDELLTSGEALIQPLQLSGEEGRVMKMTEYIQIETAERPSKKLRGVETQDLPGNFPCDQCGKVFNRLRYLRFHLQHHKLKKDLMCAACSKTFKSKNNLAQHLKTHEDREAYKCQECDFESMVNIAIHKHRQIHNGNSLICEICGHAYSDKSTLRKHKQVHDPARPFGCSQPGCTWRFRTRVMCNAHIQAHNSKGRFECAVCSYAFRQRHHLQRHEKTVHNIVHETRPTYRTYFNNHDTDFNESQYDNVENESRNEMVVAQGVNLIINEGNISNVITTDHFDLESALQNGQLVIAADDGSINYEMSDISSNVVYQTLLQEGEVQQFETQTICVPQSDASQMAYEEVETVQSEVEIMQT